jgi:two-component system, NtrC family, response regulator HydG
MNAPTQILIVDDDGRMARTLVDILRLKGYAAETARSGPEALEKVRGRAFNCVLTDLKMPGMSGLELHLALRALQPDLPVVLMTAYATDELIDAGREQGVIATLGKPLDLNELLGFFAMLRDEQTVVIVDDDPRFCQTLEAILRARGYHTLAVTDPRLWPEPPGSQRANDTSSQIVLLDLKLKETNGLEVLKRIRAQCPDLPVVLVTGYREEMAAVLDAALPLNVYAQLYKPLKIEALLQILAEVRQTALRGRLSRPARHENHLGGLAP